MVPTPRIEETPAKTPRKASLRIAHQGICKNANKTSLDSLRGCTCSPSYYTFHRNTLGKVVKGKRVKDRQVAERSLRKEQVGIDEGRTGQAKPAPKSFNAWADEYLGILETHGRKPSTPPAYLPSIAYGSGVFGELGLHEIGNPELRQVVAKIRENDGGDATVSKHLRHLGAIFQAAADDNLIATNPVPKFKKSLGLKVVGGVAAFTDEELARLWTSMEAARVEPVYLALYKTALTTGARRGELIGASMDDLDLLNGRLEIRHHWDRESGTLTTPKDGETRMLHLIPPARAVLEDWIARRPIIPMDDRPLFPAPHQPVERCTQRVERLACPSVLPHARDRRFRVCHRGREDPRQVPAVHPATMRRRAGPSPAVGAGCARPQLGGTHAEHLRDVERLRARRRGRKGRAEGFPV